MACASVGLLPALLLPLAFAMCLLVIVLFSAGDV